jgi:hypothetical protein
MATLFAMAVRSSRSAVAFATAIALLLPLPSRCASCSIGQDRCPRCANVAESLRSQIRRGEDSDENRGSRTCCQRHAPNISSATGAVISSIDRSHHTCGCNLRPAPRSSSSIQKFTASPEIVAGLAHVADATFSFNDGAKSTIDFQVAVPPPIPHRILHCSWII